MKNKVTRRHLFALSAALAAAFSLSAPALAKDKLSILVSMPQPSPFFLHMNKAIRDEAKRLGGIELIEVNAQDSTTQQVADIEAAIAKGVDGILISPREVDGLAGVLTQAIAAKIPVVTVDRRVSSVPGILGHFGADNVQGGEAQAQMIIKMFPKGANIINLQGVPGSSPAIDRSKGLHKVMDGLSAKYKIVFEQTANFQRDQGLSVTESALAALKTPPDFIVCANDDMALGALQALAGRNLLGKVHVVGFDALPEALASVRDGKLSGTVEQMPGKQASMALQALTGFARKGTKPAQAVTLLTPFVVAKDNLKTAERIGEVK